MMAEARERVRTALSGVRAGMARIGILVVAGVPLMLEWMFSTRTRRWEVWLSFGLGFRKSAVGWGRRREAGSIRKSVVLIPWPSPRLQLPRYFLLRQKHVDVQEPGSKKERHHSLHFFLNLAAVLHKQRYITL